MSWRVSAKKFLARENASSVLSGSGSNQEPVTSEEPWKKEAIPDGPSNTKRKFSTSSFIVGREEASHIFEPSCKTEYAFFVEWKICPRVLYLYILEQTEIEQKKTAQKPTPWHKKSGAATTIVYAVEEWTEATAAMPSPVETFDGTRSSKVCYEGVISVFSVWPQHVVLAKSLPQQPELSVFLDFAFEHQCILLAFDEWRAIVETPLARSNRPNWWIDVLSKYSLGTSS